MSVLRLKQMKISEAFVMLVFQDGRRWSFEVRNGIPEGAKLFSIVGIGFVKRTAPQRYEVKRYNGGCGEANIIEIKKNCPLDACSLRVMHHRWIN